MSIAQYERRSRVRTAQLRGFRVRESLPEPAPAPSLESEIRRVLRARHLSRRTEKAYLSWIRRFVLSCGRRHPKYLGKEEDDLTRALTAGAVTMTAP